MAKRAAMARCPRWASTARKSGPSFCRTRNSGRVVHRVAIVEGAQTEMKRFAVALALSVLCFGRLPAQAADWPTRPIRIVAPSTPGGAADMFGRLLCDHFNATFHERCF